MKKKRGPSKGMKYIGTNKYHFGQVLAALRRRRGLTQAQLAQRLATTSRTVSYYERESRNPSLEIVRNIATVLEVSPEQLLRLSDETPSVQPAADRSLSSRLELAQKLPQAARVQLKKFIDTLAQAHRIHA